MGIWDSVTGTITGALDATSAKWEELKTAINLLKERASVLQSLIAEMKAMPLSQEKQNEARDILSMYGTVSGLVDKAMAAFRTAYAAVTDEKQLQGLGVPVIAIGLIVAAIPVVYFAVDSVNATIARTQAFIAGERAARNVIESGGSSAEANAARVGAIKAYTSLATSTATSFGSGIASASKSLLPVLAIGAAIYFLPKLLRSRKKVNPSVAFKARQAARRRV